MGIFLEQSLHCLDKAPQSIPLVIPAYPLGPHAPPPFWQIATLALYVGIDLKVMLADYLGIL